MLQSFRRFFRCSRPGVAGVLVCAWLTAGVAPCLMAAPVQDHHADHDCPHCDTVVVAASCEVPADAIPPSSAMQDDEPDSFVASAAGRSTPAVHVHRAFAPPDRPPPRERSLLHRFCRLLE